MEETPVPALALDQGKRADPECLNWMTPAVAPGRFWDEFLQTEMT